MKDLQRETVRLREAHLRPGATSAGSPVKVAPIRTCVGCRTQAPHFALQRLVACTEGASVSIQLDYQAKMPGRGVWLHAHLDCVTTALHRKALQRSLHIATTVDLTEVEQWRARLQVSAAGA